MKVKEFKEAVSPSALLITEIRRLVEGKDDNADLDLIDRNDYFAWKLWSEEDIAGEIKAAGYDPTPENIAAVINHGGTWASLSDCTDGEWDCIREEIESVLSLR